MFADDTQLFHSSENSIKESFNILETYCKASGALLNLHKTKGLSIGAWRNKKMNFNKIKWFQENHVLSMFPSSLVLKINYLKLKKGNERL